MFELEKKVSPFVFDVKKPECVDVDYLTYVRDMQQAELEKDEGVRVLDDKTIEILDGVVEVGKEKHVDVDEVVSESEGGLSRLPSEAEFKNGVVPVSPSSAQAPQQGAIAPSRVSMVEGLGSVFGGGKATNDGNIQKLATIDKDLGLKTDIKDVVAMTCLDMIVVEAGREGLDVVAKTYETISERLRVNLASHKGWRSRQLERIYSSRREEENENPELQDKLGGLGKRGSR